MNENRSDSRGRALSLVIPAYNEAEALPEVIKDARSTLEALGIEHEILVVDDCSSDATAQIAESMQVRVIRNLQNGGYGFSLMRGIERARFPAVAIVDGDGSYPLRELPKLVEQYQKGFAMVVAHRQGKFYSSSIWLRLLRLLFRALAEFVVGRSVPDVNSGMRVFDREAVLPLFPHISYGFSFTTSVTLLFMLQAMPVTYVPVPYLKRRGSSKVRYLRDSLRALQIVGSITARLNPIKAFLLAALANLVLLLPIVLLLSDAAELGTRLVLVLEGSAILVGLGLAVEALSRKPPL